MLALSSATLTRDAEERSIRSERGIFRRFVSFFREVWIETKAMRREAHRLHPHVEL
jgi:hypothetical protein